jgi:hypothetical protein
VRDKGSQHGEPAGGASLIEGDGPVPHSSPGGAAGSERSRRLLRFLIATGGSRQNSSEIKKSTSATKNTILARLTKN